MSAVYCIEFWFFGFNFRLCTAYTIFSANSISEQYNIEIFESEAKAALIMAKKVYDFVADKIFGT